MIIMRNLFKPVIHRIWVDTLVSQVFFMGMKGGIGTKKVLITFAFFGTVIALLRRDYFFLKVAVLVFVIMNSTLAALFLSKKFMISLRILPCYVVIAQFFWLFFLLFTADRLLQLKKGLYHLGIVVAVLALVFIVRDNQFHPDKGRVAIMRSLPEFLDTIYEQEQIFATQPEKVTTVIYEHANGSRHFIPKAVIGIEKLCHLPQQQIVIRAEKE